MGPNQGKQMIKFTHVDPSSINLATIEVLADKLKNHYQSGDRNVREDFYIHTSISPCQDAILCFISIDNLTASFFWKLFGLPVTPETAYSDIMDSDNEIVILLTLAKIKRGWFKSKWGSRIDILFREKGSPTNTVTLGWFPLGKLHEPLYATYNMISVIKNMSNEQRNEQVIENFMSLSRQPPTFNSLEDSLLTW